MLLLCVQSVWKQRWPQPRLTMSVSLVVVGCVVAGIGDLSFDGWGYMFAFASVVMQSVYLLLIEFKVRGAEIHVRGAECGVC